MTEDSRPPMRMMMLREDQEDPRLAKDPYTAATLGAPAMTYKETEVTDLDLRFRIDNAKVAESLAGMVRESDPGTEAPGFVPPAIKLKNGFERIQELDVEIYHLKDAYYKVLRPNQHVLEFFVNEHMAWRSWVTNYLAVYRMLHNDDKSVNIRAVEAEIGLMENRILQLKDGLRGSDGV